MGPIFVKGLVKPYDLVDPLDNKNFLQQCSSAGKKFFNIFLLGSLYFPLKSKHFEIKPVLYISGSARELLR